MAKKPSLNKKKKQQQQNSSRYEYKGFKFATDDEQLQERYVTAWQYYANVLPEFPKPKLVGWADAKSMTSGSNAKDLAVIENVYTRQSDLMGDVASGKHKYQLFDDLGQDLKSKTINNYIKDVYKFFSRIEKTTGSKILNASDTRYNIVYYIDHPDVSGNTNK